MALVERRPALGDSGGAAAGAAPDPHTPAITAPQNWQRVAPSGFRFRHFGHKMDIPIASPS